MAANFEKWGVSGWLTIIGIGELTSNPVPYTSHFLPRRAAIERTHGGAIVIHMSNGEPFIFPAVLLCWSVATTPQYGDVEQL